MALAVFGLTGGLASGKSTVARRFRERGLDVVDADQVARDVVAKGTPGLAAVVEAFGPRVLAPSGELDRAALAAVAFADEASRKKLNAITHPRIGARTAERMAELEAKGARVACYEAALLVENGLADAFRPLVVVALSEALQLERAMLRDASSEEQARARIAAQKPLTEKIALADHVIDTSGSLAQVTARADDVLDAIFDALGVPRLPR